MTTWLAGSLVACVACQAHPVYPEGTSEQGSDDDDDDDGDPPGPWPAPTSGPGTGTDVPTTGIAEGTTGSAGSTGADESTSGASTTTAPPGTCGDGFVDPGEGCDLSFSGNADDGPCTQSCQAAHCGTSTTSWRRDCGSRWR